MAQGEAPAEARGWGEEAGPKAAAVWPAGDEGQKLRADARRNRAHILEAAEAVFATQGPGAPIDEVARQAGLGVGTLYRHFPTKEALFEAIVLGRLERLVGEARSRLEAADPGSALFSFLARFFEQVLETKALSGALASAGVDVQAKRHSELWRELWQQLLSATGTLLVRAQRAGLVRPDVGVDDLMALCTGTSHAMDQFGGTCSAQRILAVVCDGLRVARAKGAARRSQRPSGRGLRAQGAGGGKPVPGQPSAGVAPQAGSRATPSGRAPGPASRAEVSRSRS